MQLQVKCRLGDGRDCEVNVEIESKVDYEDLTDAVFEEAINVLTHRSVLALEQLFRNKTSPIITLGK